MESARLEGAQLRRGERFIAGDSLRAIAALAVFVWHAAKAIIQDGGSPTSEWVSAYGSVAGRLLEHLEIGLYLFFVLSGYLLARPFVQSWAAGERRPSVRRYAKNRFLRIAPAFWVVAAYVLIRYGVHNSSTLQVALVPTFLQTYDWSPAANLLFQAWTLDAEVLFYFLIPFAAVLFWRWGPRRLGERGRLLAVIGTCAFAFCVQYLMRRGFGPDQIITAKQPPQMVWAFLPGVSLAALEPLVLDSGSRLRRFAWPGALALLGLAALAAAASAAKGDPSLGSAAVLVAIASGAFVALPLWTQWTTGGAWRVLDNPVMRWLGERSYGIYLVHPAVSYATLRWTLEGDHSPAMRFLIALAINLPITLVVSDLLHRLVERPALSLKDRTWRGREPAVEPVAEPAKA